MANPELLIRSIIGDARSSIRPLDCAAEIISDLFFVRHIPLEDIHAKQVYPFVAERLNLSTCAASRRVQRLAHICWDSMREKGLVLTYIGQPLKYCPDACRLVGYLVVYAHLQTPYFVAIEKDTSLLFYPSFDSPLYPSGGQISGGPRENGAMYVTQVAVLEKVCYPVCPGCGLTLEHGRQNYCGHCGKPLDWSIFPGSAPALPEENRV